ncbi:formylglycine-generating enzyme family protein [bacterium]|nr:formylglycine-generating enzyme family protein [bacterium]
MSKIMQKSLFILLFTIMLHPCFSTDIEVEVLINDGGFVSYDSFKAVLNFYNYSNRVSDAMIYGILEIYGQYYYWPGFGTDVDFQMMNINSFKTEVTLLEFFFPDFDDEMTFGPLSFWGAYYLSSDNYGYDVKQFWLGDEYKWTPTPIPTPVPIEFSLIPAGTFQMGSPVDELCRSTNGEGPVHTVTLTRNFLMQITEVTQQQWVNVFGINPSNFEGVNRPVDGVNWFDACVFCNRMSLEDGLTPCYYTNESFTTMFDGTPPIDHYGTVYWNQNADGYRLSTEAEWEYACRAGTTTTYNNGTDITSCYNQDPNLDSIAWYRHNAHYETQNVGLKESNEWDLYDMHGNLEEWVWDIYNPNFYRNSPPTDPTGPATGDIRVMRGGCWMIYPATLRSASRSWYHPGVNRDIIGFRMVKFAP